MRSKRSPQLAGFEVRHQRRCRVRDNAGACTCRPSYRGRIAAGRNQRITGPWKRSLAEAKAWRAKTLMKLERGEYERPTRRTVAEAAAEWIAGARIGVVRNRSGRRYKPSALRSYEIALQSRVIPVFGREALAAITRPRLQQWVRTLLADGLSPSSVRNTLAALQVLYRHALDVGEVQHNPTSGLKMPAVERREPRYITPTTAAALIEALSLDDGAVYATAFYAGLRRGELWALRWSDVDFRAGVIRVRRNEDVVEGEIEPKSSSGRRAVPLIRDLAALLAAHHERGEGEGRERVFPGERGGKFSAEALAKRARQRWEAAGLIPVGLHDCRHTFASFMIDAGVNAKALSAYMGHSPIDVTFDLYGHLMPGSEAEAASLLEAYLNRKRENVSSQARGTTRRKAGETR
jgi:integrase